MFPFGRRNETPLLTGPQLASSRLTPRFDRTQTFAFSFSSTLQIAWGFQSNAVLLSTRVTWCQVFHPGPDSYRSCCNLARLHEISAQAPVALNGIWAKRESQFPSLGSFGQSMLSRGIVKLQFTRAAGSFCEPLAVIPIWPLLYFVCPAGHRHKHRSDLWTSSSHVNKPIW